MRRIRFIASIFLIITTLLSCDKTLQVNADWKDITVVYGLLDQSQDTTFIKVTKAFLGPGNALQFAKIPDSSNYPDSSISVTLEEYISAAYTTPKQTFLCKPIIIHNKKAGDSVFYFPDQLLYYTSEAKLNKDYLYKLYIRNKNTGKVITAQTELVHDFSITIPQQIASFPPKSTFEVKWDPAKNGKRYQLDVRFYYTESLISDPNHTWMDSIDWVVFNDIRSIDPTKTSPPIDLYFSGDAFYSVVGAKVPTTTTLNRVPDHCYFIFSVAAPEFNTYMEVTEPSQSLVQEKPAYTNVVNGIGVFSARYTKYSLSLMISDITKNELKVNPQTINRGF